MTDITRRHLIAGAAATAAVAAMPAAAVAAVETSLDYGVGAGNRMALDVLLPFPDAPYVDGQRFCDGVWDWTFYKRRREWIGVRCEPLTEADLAEMEKPLPPSPDDYDLDDLDDDGNLKGPTAEV